MKQTEYLNSPLRCCSTCAFYVPSEIGLSFAKCNRFQESTYTAVMLHCGPDLTEWRMQPPPPLLKPRRSLRQWFYDTFWKLDEAPSVPNGNEVR